MTTDDLRFVALIDRRLDDAARDREQLERWHADGYLCRRCYPGGCYALEGRRPCPGCVETCNQCDADALD